jgi:hypothetical protein
MSQQLSEASRESSPAVLNARSRHAKLTVYLQARNYGPVSPTEASSTFSIA